LASVAAYLCFGDIEASRKQKFNSRASAPQRSKSVKFLKGFKDPKTYWVCKN